MEALTVIVGLIVVFIIGLYIRYRLAWRKGWNRSRAWEAGDTFTIKFRTFDGTEYKMVYVLLSKNLNYVKFARVYNKVTYVEIRYYNDLDNVDFLSSVED